MFRHHLVFAAMLAASAPSAALAAPQWNGTVVMQFGSPAQADVAYRAGFDRGLRAGEDAVRHGRAFRFDNESDYRRGDYGYRNQFGDRDRYREAFRRGFEAGFRQGYDRFRFSGGDNRGGSVWDERPMYDRRDNIPAARNGYRDGFDAGRDDARHHRRFDPLAQRRYRSGDHDYDRNDGPRERYQDLYRSAFRDGYSDGYRENNRY